MYTHKIITFSRLLYALNSLAQIANANNNNNDYGDNSIMNHHHTSNTIISTINARTQTLSQNVNNKKFNGFEESNTSADLKCTHKVKKKLNKYKQQKRCRKTHSNRIKIEIFNWFIRMKITNRCCFSTHVQKKIKQKSFSRIGLKLLTHCWKFKS